MPEKYTILVCDDEEDIVAGLKIFLKNADYDVLCAYDGRQALKLLEQNTVHLVLMDVMMPGISGIDTVMRMRESGYNIPVILLTAKSEDADKVLGLNCGADDYVTKPFNMLEVLARVRSQLRRVQVYSGAPEETENKQTVLRNGRIELDDHTKTVRVDGEEIHLTRTEYDILYLFMTHIGEIFPLTEIFRRIKHEEPFGAENTVAVHIRHLREKIEFDPANPTYIRVRFGHGYKMEKR